MKGEMDIMWKEAALLKKGKVAGKAYRGSRCIAPPILNLGTWWRWMMNSTIWSLYPPSLSSRQRTPVPSE
jgi:hypothetical protein